MPREKVNQLCSLLIERAIGNIADEQEQQYAQLRAEMMRIPYVMDKAPEFLRQCRDIKEFWYFIKEIPSYRERRKFLRDSFDDLVNFLDQRTIFSESSNLFVAIENVDSNYILNEWTKIKARVLTDPDAAITSARTLLECVCKHILSECGQESEEAHDLQDLYRKACRELNMAPEQHTEQVFKKILSGVVSIVGGLASIRNRYGDAHGKAITQAKPSARHAEYVAHLACATADFLLKSLEEKVEREANPLSVVR